jgi:hypothetical protein
MARCRFPATQGVFATIAAGGTHRAGPAKVIPLPLLGCDQMPKPLHVIENRLKGFENRRRADAPVGSAVGALATKLGGR